RAAAKEDRGDLARTGALAHVCHFAREGGCKTLLIDLLVPDMAVEVAIRAFGGTERPVHIDPEAGAAAIRDHALSSKARLNFSNARARCDKGSVVPCF